MLWSVAAGMSGGSGGVVNSVDFYPTSLKSPMLFLLPVCTFSQWKAVTVKLQCLHGCQETHFVHEKWCKDTFHFCYPPSPFPCNSCKCNGIGILYCSTSLDSTLFIFIFITFIVTQREATSTQKLRPLVPKITRGINSCKLALLNCPTQQWCAASLSQLLRGGKCESLVPDVGEVGQATWAGRNRLWLICAPRLTDHY